MAKRYLISANLGRSHVYLEFEENLSEEEIKKIALDYFLGYLTVGLEEVPHDKK